MGRRCVDGGFPVTPHSPCPCTCAWLSSGNPKYERMQEQGSLYPKTPSAIQAGSLRPMQTSLSDREHGKEIYERDSRELIQTSHWSLVGYTYSSNLISKPYSFVSTPLLDLAQIVLLSFWFQSGALNKCCSMVVKGHAFICSYPDDYKCLMCQAFQGIH